jgi:tetratricopeptide (TPR) repeat protein
MKDALAQASKLLKDKKVESAANLYRKVLQTDPSNALAHQGLAACYLEDRKLDDAMREAHNALKSDSGLSIPHRILANIYLHSRQFDLYEQELHNIIEKEPSSDIYITLSGYLLYRKRITESISVLQKATEFDPYNWLLHYYLSIAYLRASQREDAFRELKIAYKMKRNFVASFAFVSTMMAINRTWLLPLLFVVFILSFVLPSLISLPLVLLIVGLQLASGLAHFTLGNIRHGILSLLLLVLYTFIWGSLKL